MRIVFTFFALLLWSICGYAQDKYTDSLKRVVYSHQDDTLGIIAYNDLAIAHLDRNEIDSGLTLTNKALSIATRRNFHKGIISACTNRPSPKRRLTDINFNYLETNDQN